MFGAVIAAVALVAIIGLAWKWATSHFKSDYSDPEYHVSWREFAAGVVIASFVVAPAVVFVGSKLSVAATLRYQEFYNGVETAALQNTTECYAGHAGSNESSGRSNCRHVYDSGDYSYWDTCPETRYYTDAEGNTQSETVWVPCLEWADIYTPYATKEATYRITDSLGGEHRFAPTYVPEDARQFSRNVPIPAGVPRGAPPEWIESRQLLDAGDPRSVTRLFGYDNYILAAGEDMLLPFSQDVDRYLEEGILPEHTANIKTDPLNGFNDAHADKVSFVGVEVHDESTWQEAVMDFNGALGPKLRGDLHMVIIDSGLVDSPENYINALRAYWLGEHFGRRAIAKNAIIVVLGVSESQVDWARAATGMPYGNEIMAQHIQDFMPGTLLMPGRVIGDPRTVITPATSDGEDDTVSVTLSETRGVLEDIIFDLAPFARACMSCEDDEGQIGFDNLVAKISPPFWQQALMVVIVGILSLFWWHFVASGTYFQHASAEPPNPKTPRTYRQYSRH